MGEAVITQVRGVGTEEGPSTPIYDGAALVTTRDPGTTTTGVEITTNGVTNLISFESITGAHRVQVFAEGATGANTTYYYVAQGKHKDISIKGGEKLVYRLDA